MITKRRILAFLGLGSLAAPTGAALASGFLPIPADAELARIKARGDALDEAAKIAEKMCAYYNARLEAESPMWVDGKLKYHPNYFTIGKRAILARCAGSMFNDEAWWTKYYLGREVVILRYYGYNNLVRVRHPKGTFILDPDALDFAPSNCGGTPEFVIEVVIHGRIAQRVDIFKIRDGQPEAWISLLLKDYTGIDLFVGRQLSLEQVHNIKNKSYDFSAHGDVGALLDDGLFTEDQG